MGSTKIINISKTDGFEDVFELIKEASADEVILIFPKSGSKFTKNPNYLTFLKKEADKSGKLLSVMTEDDIIADLASTNGIAVLGRSKKKRASSIKDNKISPLQSAGEIEEGEYVEPEVVSKMITDIIPERPDSAIKVKHEDYKPVSIDVKKAEEEFFGPQVGEDENVNESESIWAEEENVTHKKHNISSRKGIIPSFGAGRFAFAKKLAVAVLILAIAFFVLANKYLVKAEITIKPKRENVDFTIKVITDSRTAVVDDAGKHIPGQKFTVNKEASDVFNASGQKNVAQKAKGKIKIFNKMVGQPQRLVATTRFESPDGFVFRIPQTILVPGAVKLGDGKVEPGMIESEVSADRPGPEYNIGPASFTIPGFKGLPQYDQLSGLSTSDIKGGVIGPAKVVTENDFNQAKEELQKRLNDMVNKDIGQQIEGLVTAGSQLNIQLGQAVANAEAGDAANELHLTLRASASVVAFRESDIDTLIENYLNDKGGLTMSHSKLDKKYENLAYGDSGNSLTFTLHVTGLAPSKIDESRVATDILGLKDEAIKRYFASISEIESVRVILSPFWVKSLPSDKNKMKLTLE